MGQLKQHNMTCLFILGVSTGWLFGVVSWFYAMIVIYMFYVLPALGKTDGNYKIAKSGEQHYSFIPILMFLNMILNN